MSWQERIASRTTQKNQVSSGTTWSGQQGVPRQNGARASTRSTNIPTTPWRDVRRWDDLLRRCSDLVTGPWDERRVR